MARCVRMNTRHGRITDTADRQMDLNTTAEVWADSQLKGDILAVTASVYTCVLNTEHGGFVFYKFQPSGDRN